MWLRHPGYLSNFLACCSTRTIFGADMRLNSLRLGDNFTDMRTD